MILTAIANGEKYTLFIPDLYKWFETERSEEGTLLHSKNDSIDLYDYHVAKCSEVVFKTMECD